jgi:hypothetical protein
VGNKEDLHNAVHHYLKNFFCNNKNCQKCGTCSALKNRQFHAVTWITPEKNYTRQTVEPLFHTLSFALQSQEHHFFILEQAHLLTPAVGNSLLKSFEEPPAGYHFILLCERLEQLLPTVVSRAVIRFINDQSSSSFQTLLPLFKNPQLDNLPLFHKTLEKEGITEQEIPLFLDTLLNFWIQQKLKVVDQEKSEKHLHAINTVLEILNSYSHHLPMPGSGKFFLRSLFLALCNL